MPLPQSHDLRRAQWLLVDGDPQPYWFCNCPSSAPNRTLRYAATHRDKHSVWPKPVQPAKDGDKK